jgi:hypothetical protein
VCAIHAWFGKAQPNRRVLLVFGGKHCFVFVVLHDAVTETIVETQRRWFWEVKKNGYILTNKGKQLGVSGQYPQLAARSSAQFSREPIPTSNG